MVQITREDPVSGVCWGREGGREGERRARRGMVGRGGDFVRPAKLVIVHLQI